jgi:hypothetical protein
LASTKRTSAAIADLHACAKDTLKCWPEARWVHVPDHTPKNQKPTATATAITAVSLILPKKMVSGCDVDPRRQEAARSSHGEGSPHGVAESCGTEIRDHISVYAFFYHAPFDIARPHKACDHKRRLRDRATATAGSLQFLQ